MLTGNQKVDIQMHENDLEIIFWDLSCTLAMLVIAWYEDTKH